MIYFQNLIVTLKFILVIQNEHVIQIYINKKKIHLFPVDLIKHYSYNYFDMNLRSFNSKPLHFNFNLHLKVKKKKLFDILIVNTQYSKR